jgi:hypothetical protein
MGIQPESSKQPTLEELLLESEKELHQKDQNIQKNNTDTLETEKTISESQTQTALAIERDILAAELDTTQKLEKGLWIGAHIACLPFFYDEYTIGAKLTPDVQKKYNSAIITTCGRFNVMGKKGTALVSPIISYIRNYSDYSLLERQELEDELIERIAQWLKGEVSLDTQPREQSSRSLQVIMEDIEHAERVFENAVNGESYMEGEVRLAVIKAIRHTDFLPALVKYKLLDDLKTLSSEHLFDIGTFLLWEIRKSSVHHHKLLFYMLRIFKRLGEFMK